MHHTRVQRFQYQGVILISVSLLFSKTQIINNLVKLFIIGKNLHNILYYSKQELTKDSASFFPYKSHFHQCQIHSTIYI